jgi:drug/metabolite transporter (DMT)-like permease
MISRADWALLAVSFIWGATFVVVKDALPGVSTFLFLALRFTLATAALGLILRKRLGEGVGGLSDHWRGALVCGLFLFLGYALQTGLRLTTASRWPS